MKIAILAASLAAILATPAFARPNRPDRTQPLTRAEVQAKVQQRFARVDANHDGVVTKAEFDAYRTKAQADRDARRGERRSEIFAMLDTNKDGQISPAEFAARPDRTAGDASGGQRDGRARMAMRGGMAGWGGWGGANGEKRAAGFFAALDADKDGKVTLAEASAKPLALFDKAVTNHDGTVTPEERQAARAAMRADWKAKRG